MLSATPRPAALWIGREPERCAPWSQVLQDAGVASGCLPLIGRQHIEPTPEERAVLHDLAAFAWVLFTSETAVRRLLEVRSRAPWPARTSAAAVGPATAAVARSLGVPVARIASGGSGRALAAELLQQQPEIVEQRVLWPAARNARPDLAEALRAAGCPLTRIDLYETLPIPGPPPPAGSALLLFSPSAARSLRTRVGDPCDHPIWAVGGTTAAAARELGFPVEVVLESPTPDALKSCLRP